MELIEELCRQANLSSLDYGELDYVEDSSEFIFVDGEEGDYGAIKYFTPKGNLLAIKTVEGSDSEFTEFTEFGKDFLMLKVFRIFLDNYEKIQTIEDQHIPVQHGKR